MISAKRPCPTNIGLALLHIKTAQFECLIEGRGGSLDFILWATSLLLSFFSVVFLSCSNDIKCAFIRLMEGSD